MHVRVWRRSSAREGWKVSECLGQEPYVLPTDAVLRMRNLKRRAGRVGPVMVSEDVLADIVETVKLVVYSQHRDMLAWMFGMPDRECGIFSGFDDVFGRDEVFVWRREFEPGFVDF